MPLEAAEHQLLPLAHVLGNALFPPLDEYLIERSVAEYTLEKEHVYRLPLHQPCIWFVVMLLCTAGIHF